MSKTIKVSEETWKRLDEVRDKHETFDCVVGKLLDLHYKLLQLPSFVVTDRKKEP
jgi:predicted CopG family antitoxin